MECNSGYHFLDDEVIKLSVNMPLHLKQKFNLFQPGERFGMITEGKSIIRKIAIKAGLDKKIVYRTETGSEFNGKYYKKIIKNFGTQKSFKFFKYKGK